jgi:predicted 3-demethylubiquinone-9 3-methyltransferase (glyoxalase superfamily)
MMQKITTFLTFDGRAEEAIQFYCDLFENSQILETQKNPDGTLMAASFELNGQRFMAMDVPGGFPKGEGVSLFIDCETQEEVDHFYDALAEGGEAQPCSWVKDKYEVSWQVVPRQLGELIGKSEGAQQMAVIQAMLKMHKIDIQALQDAFDNN